VLRREISHFVKKTSDSTKMLSETDVINMLEFLIDNIFAVLGGLFFQQTVGILMGTNCALRLADLFLYSYETDFIPGFLKKNEKNLASSFNFTTLAILCYETQSDKLPNSVFQLRVTNSCVEGREVKCFNAIAGGEGPRLYVL
jgi:hypothetical protein